MRIVLDTNCLLVCLPKKSKYRPVFDAFLKNKFTLIVSNEIINEYAEIIGQKTNAIIVTNVLELFVAHSNVEKAEVYYKWHLIKRDPDDNKFADCAIAGNADFIVTNDKHFPDLKKVSFPIVKTITLDAFLKMIKKIKNE